MKKEHFEVLLENMSGKIDLVLEGHTTLNKKIDDNQRKNEEDHNFLQQMIKGVSQETKNLRKEFVDFRKENEAAHTALNKKLDTRKKETSDTRRRVSRLEAARA